jgi:hypothetical protein
MAHFEQLIYSQVFYFEPKAGGEVRIFGFYTNKQTNKQEGEGAGFIGTRRWKVDQNTKDYSGEKAQNYPH